MQSYKKRSFSKRFSIMIYLVRSCVGIHVLHLVCL